MPRGNSWNRSRATELKMGYSFLIPVILFLFFFIFLATIYCFYMSFFEWKLFDLGAQKTFVGLDNYMKIFSDEVFGVSMLNTLTIVVICIFVEMTIGFFIALALWTIKKSLRTVQAMILLPMITSPVIVGLIWRYMYDTQFGIINYFLREIFSASTIAWLGNEKLSLISVIIVDIWQMTPFVVLILYAGMTAISEELFEAAQVDGASYWKIVKKIVMPSILPMISFAVLMRTMDLFKIFDTVYVMTGGGPGISSQTIAMYTYKTGFSYSHMGYAMALSIITLICIISLSTVYMINNKKREG